MTTAQPDTLIQPSDRMLVRAALAYAEALDEAAGDLIRDAVTIHGGTDGLAVVSSVTPDLPVAAIVADAMARETTDPIR